MPKPLYIVVFSADVTECWELNLAAAENCLNVLDYRIVDFKKVKNK